VRHSFTRCHADFRKYLEYRISYIPLGHQGLKSSYTYAYAYVYVVHLSLFVCLAYMLSRNFLSVSTHYVVVGAEIPLLLVTNCKGLCSQEYTNVDRSVTLVKDAIITCSLHMLAIGPYIYVCEFEVPDLKSGRKSVLRYKAEILLRYNCSTSPLSTQLY
jgi:hypothetical protein